MNGPYRPRRFYKEAKIAAFASGFSVLLDGRPLKTPAKRDLVLPNMALARALAEEWAAQAETIEPDSMPLMRIIATALDRTVDQREQVIEEVTAFAKTDLLCYRADHPAALAERQAQVWQPWLEWLSERHGIALAVTDGIIAISQTEAALKAVQAFVGGQDSFRLTILYFLTGTLGSVVLAIAVLEGALEAEAAFTLSQLDEVFQAEKWGEDQEAVQRREGLRRDILGYARFLRLLAE